STRGPNWLAAQRMTGSRWLRRSKGRGRPSDAQLPIRPDPTDDKLVTQGSCVSRNCLGHELGPSDVPDRIQGTRIGKGRLVDAPFVVAVDTSGPARRRPSGARLRDPTIAASKPTLKVFHTALWRDRWRYVRID